MTCIQLAPGTVVCRSSDRLLRKRYLRCPMCQCTTEHVLRFDGVYGLMHMCCRCGDAWSEGELMERPFYRYWRRDSIRQHRALWDLASHGPDPTVDELFPELTP